VFSQNIIKISKILIQPYQYNNRSHTVHVTLRL